MTAYIKEKHRNSPNDEKHNYYIKECHVVPSCFVLVKDGIPQKMTEAESEEIKTKLSEELQVQSNTNKKLKYLRDQIEKVRKQVSESIDENETDNLKRQIVELDTAYEFFV